MGKKIICLIVMLTFFLGSCRSQQRGFEKSTEINKLEDLSLYVDSNGHEENRLHLDLDRTSFDNNISDKDIKKWIDYLTQEKMSGRRAGSIDEELMLRTVEKSFDEWGLEPAFKNGYRHQFSFVDQIEIGKSNSLIFKNKKSGSFFPTNKKLVISKDYEPYVFSKNSNVALSNITFAGYGISAPSMGNRPRYNSYETIDVKNKWVLLLDGVPEKMNSDLREQLLPYARIEHKALMASKRGALGLLLIGVTDQVDLIRHSKNLQGVALPLPVVVLSKKLAENIFAEEGLSFSDLEKKIISGDEVISFDFSELQAQADVELIPRIKKAFNVVGKIKGIHSRAPALIVGAHGDHLGKDEKGRPFVGADDNASGVSAVMELAQDLSQIQKKQPKSFQKDIYFAIWSAEELGNLGSAEFVRDSDINFSAALNFDMIGRYRGSLFVQGVASASGWKPLLRESELMSGLRFEQIEDPYAPTDAVSFYESQVPSLNFYTGAHSDYHALSDTADKINIEGIRRTAIAAKFILLQLSAQKSSYLNYQDYHLLFTQQVRDGKIQHRQSEESSLLDSF